ncbi:hypothetical protein A9Q78_10420 [Methylophaga sp. 41_12_T18]|nr:hypothetical protein A9Q78_10420 [Methylophaga sp. 41_12_T18]
MHFSVNSVLNLNIRYILLSLAISFFLVACGDNKVAPIEIIKLSSTNIDAFTVELANDYLTTVDSLVTEFKKHKKANDAYGFTQYRNYYWTPAYIEKKDYYAAVIEQNRDFLANSKIRPIFNKFDNLIYFGVDLKNSLLEKDRKLLDKTMVSLKKEKADVIAVLKATGLVTEFKKFRKANAAAPAPLPLISY